MPTRVAAVLGVACLAASVVGCSATEGEEEQPRGFEPLVSMQAIDRLPAESPKATVLRVWRYAQIGTTPNVVVEYHRRVRQIVGRTTIASAFSIKRPYFTSTQPTRLVAEQTALGTLVRVTTTSNVRDGEPVSTAQELPKGSESFLLRRVGTRWKVVHDTLLERALTEYFISLEPLGPDGEPTPSALAKGRSASRTYRELFLPDL